ncbi:MAG TPA: DUF4397 domain-containing protein [Gemmatimonadaceae bacterium]|nr:DUF4397 domain-containing protein [Gemmatimonadaceae bacterium]
MRRNYYFTALVLAAGALSACRPDEVIKTEDIPTAGVRFINALPDSAGAFGLDFRFVDIVENNAQYHMTYRNGPATTSGVTGSNLTEFRPARAGSRHFRIFLDDSLQTAASTVLDDETVTLEAGKNYTVIIWGQARLGTMKVTMFEDVPADPGPGNVALRVLNATNAAIDGRYYLQGGAAPATASWAGVAAYSASSFLSVPKGDYMYNIRAAGSATNYIATDLLALKGTAATVDIGAIPGTEIAGSAVTLVVYPPSTAGSRAAQFSTAGGAFMWDRRPSP